MKTRIIQNEPEASASQPSTSPPDEGRPSTNLAGRMGRWSAQHRKTAIFGWLGFVVVAFALGIVSGTTKIEQATSGVGESGRIDKLLHEEFVQPAGESVLIQSDTLTVKDPAFTAAVEDVITRVSAVDVVTDVQSPLDPENAGQVGQAGHAALIDFEITGDPDDALTKIDPVIAAVGEAKAANPDVFIGSFGVSGEKEIEAAFLDDLKKAGLLSIPVTLIILIVVFGALVAAGIPLLLALTAIIATFGLVALPTSLIPIDEVTYELILLIGLAVGVDYSMFYLKREREERAAGRSEEAALEAAAATSGRSVLISGLTVIVAMSGMFLAGVQGMSAFALGTILVVAVAMLGSLTVLPATLSWLGDRVERGRVPFVNRLRRDDGEGRIWGKIVGAVLRRPVISVVLSAGFLLALAVPALQLRTVQAGVEAFPQSLPSIQTYNRIQEAFPGNEIPAGVVVKANDVSAPAVQEAIGQLEWRALATGQMHEPITIDVNDSGTIATIAIPVDGTGTDADSEAALATLRDEIVPTTVGALPNAEVGVTGTTAQSKDFNDKLELRRSARVRVRAPARVPPHALRFQIDRDRVQGDRPQPHLDRSRLRGHGARVPARLGQEHPRLRVHGRHRRVSPHLHVRDPLRALDGLPRVHHQPHPRGLRPWDEHRGGDHPRDQDDGRSGDQRGNRDGLRLRGLRHALDADLQAVRRRARGGDPHRRDHRPRRAASGHDEAARRLELVPAPLARVASAPRPRLGRDPQGTPRPVSDRQVSPQRRRGRLTGRSRRVP